MTKNKIGQEYVSIGNDYEGNRWRIIDVQQIGKIIELIDKIIGIIR